MVVMAVRVNAKYGIGLDLNPSNFARGEDRLYYLDDELYPTLSEPLLAGALVARIPEEPGVSPAEWKEWGAHVVRDLDAAGFATLAWERIADEILQYPVAGQFEASRAALGESFHARVVAMAKRRRGRARAASRRVTCVLADVHANLPALEAILGAAGAAGADSYLFVGDAVGYGPHPAECIARIAELGDAILLRGNHDHAVASAEFDVGMAGVARHCAEWTRSVLSEEALAWLAALPVDHIEAGWMAVHGAPRDPRRFFAYVYELTYEDNLRHLAQQRMPVCFYGHTHVQLAYATLAGGPAKVSPTSSLDISGRGPVLVNPGSVGQPRDGDPRAAFALWDRRASAVSFHRVVYDVDRTLRDLRDRGLPEPLSRRLRTGT